MTNTTTVMIITELGKMSSSALFDACNDLTINMAKHIFLFSASRTIAKQSSFLSLNGSVQSHVEAYTRSTKIRPGMRS